MAIISMKQLLEAGVHFGHQTRRWNPKMKKYIFTERNGIYIIDLQKTVKKIDEAYNYVRDLAANGGTILFVGTKKQAQEAMREEASRVGMYYVNQRWLGGTLTNFGTIQKRVTQLKNIEKMESDGTFDVLPKKEVILLRKEKDKLEKFLSGIKDMKGIPDAMFIVDPRKERIAVAEAHKLHIPIVAMCDTNCDPDEIDYVIPSNDDAIRAVKLIATRLADAVIEGRQGEDYSEDVFVAESPATEKVEAPVEVVAETPVAEAVESEILEVVEAPKAEAVEVVAEAVEEKAPKAKAKKAAEEIVEEAVAEVVEEKAPKAKKAPKAALDTAEVVAEEVAEVAETKK